MVPFLPLTDSVEFIDAHTVLLCYLLKALPTKSRVDPVGQDLFFIYIFFIYLFMRDTERERGRDTGRGGSRLRAGSPIQDSIPGPQDQALG